MLKASLRKMLPFLFFGASAIAAQMILHAMSKEFCLTQLTMAIYYSIVAMGLCLLMGYAGQVSLGHGAFFAIGGYTTAFLTTFDLAKHQKEAWAAVLIKLQALTPGEDLYGNPIVTVSPWTAFSAAMLVAGVIAWLIGWPALRLKGHYLSMATLGFGLIINKVILGTAWLGAADGITGVPDWNMGFGLVISGKSSLRVSNYYAACVLALFCMILLRNLLHSRAGRALQAIHDREIAANMLGVNTAAYKLKAFVASALLAAAAGVFFTHYTAGIGPSEAGAMKSVRHVALTAAGGMGNLWGVTLVSILINYFSLRGWFGTYDHFVFGALLITIMTFAPDGPLKPLGAWLKRVFRGAQKPAETQQPAEARP